MRVQLSSGPKSLSDYSIEIATENHDMGAIAAMVNAAYKKVAYLREDIDRVTSLKIADEIRNPLNKLYLCLSPTKTVCGTLLVDFPEAGQAKFHLFAIHPDSQGAVLVPNS